MKVVRYEGKRARTETYYDDRRKIVYDHDGHIEIYYPDRCEIYNAENQLHNSIGPAIDYFDGPKEYYLFGQQMPIKEWEIFPRECIHSSGMRTWHDYYHLSPHRTDGEPAVIYPDGRKEWRQKGILHRSAEPAVICPDGRKEWWHHGQLRKVCE